jgi:nuclear pore complex protein Nup88
MTVEPSYSPSPTPKEELEWFPLPKHPLFTTTTTATSGDVSRNLLAFDEVNNRLYFWDSNNNCLHRLSLRLGDPDPTSVLAASPSKVLLSFSFFLLLIPPFAFFKLGFCRTGN